MIDFIFDRFKKEYPERKWATFIYAFTCCILIFFVDIGPSFWHGVLYVFIYLFAIGCYKFSCEEYIKIEFKDMSLKKDIYLTMATSYIFFQGLNAVSLIFLFQKNLLIMKGMFIINNIFIMLYTFLFYAYEDNKGLNFKRK